MLDDILTTLIRERQITGLSLAVIQNGKIAKEQGYGFADNNGESPVTPATLFQAGSVSKSVAALGALRLVEDGRLSLDADVNTLLRAWKLPENEFTNNRRITLLDILSHSAGLTVHGFPGYSVSCAVPTLVEVLDGVKPANTSAIRVDIVPGSQSRYSGGGYVVMQQMIIDTTGKSFPDFMRDSVLVPLGMASSTYEQPLPEAMVVLAATGYDRSGKAVIGRWHVYPEMAAAGLWTTASDLARFAIGVQQSFAGGSPIISQSLTRRMLTSQKGNLGFGVFLEGAGKTLRFYHGGRNRGFDALLMAYASAGNGVVILSNTNDDSGVIKDIIKAVAKEYHWL